MKIPKVVFILIAAGIVSNSVQGAETNDMPRVGSLREFNRFIFEGDATFPAQNLWMGLNSTFDFPELSHPLAPRDAFLAAIESHLRLGYLHCGFPDAQIAANYDARTDRVMVRIKEGTRYFCGPVEVLEARKMPTQPIVRALTVTNVSTGALLEPFQFLDNAPANRTEVTETNNPNAWAEGQPAHFDDISLRSLSNKVTNTLAKHGFFLARFSFNVATNTATRLAKLQVKITDEGPPAIIDRIKVKGNRRNSDKVLLNYLGLKRGMKFTSDLAATINDRLYHSARFLTNSIQASMPDSSGRLRLTIEVLENSDGPTLTGDYNSIEKTMLKARNWLAKLGDNQQEAVLSASGYSEGAPSVQCIIAPRKGSLILESAVVSGTNRLRHALIMSPRQIALYVPRLQQKYVTDVSMEQFKSYVTVETCAPEKDGNTANISFGAGLTSLTEATGAPPYALSMSLAPAAFLRLAHPKSHASWFAGDQLICSNANSVLKLNAKTGEFIEFTGQTEESTRGQMSLRFEPDAFESALAQIKSAGAGFTNVCRTNAPFSSAITFFGSELVQLPAVNSYLQTKLPAVTCAQLPALLRRLITVDFLSPFDVSKGLRGATNETAANFEIPEAPRPANGGSFGSEIAAGAQYVFVGSDLIFPPRSWPWTITRDLAFLSRGQQTYLQPDMTEIYGSFVTGPIGYLASARLMEICGSSISKIMATRGLQQLSTEAFRSDYRLLLDEHYAAGQFAAQLAIVLGHLDELELDALVAPMNASEAEFIRDCAQRVREAKKDQPLVETIAPSLDAYWEKALKQTVADQLKKIAQE